MNQTVIVDYDGGNLHSAIKAFQKMSLEVGGHVIVSNTAKDVLNADRIVLPGDGAFPACRRALGKNGALYEALIEAVRVRARPFLGICVGMQMLADTGYEYEKTAGLGWLSGDIIKIEHSTGGLKVPHMGWNDLIIDHPHPVLEGVETGDHVYFVHSYHFKVSDAHHQLAHVDYGGRDIAAIVGRDTIVGTQFHPEKSQSVGLRIIKNFLLWKP